MKLTLAGSIALALAAPMVGEAHAARSPGDQLASWRASDRPEGWSSGAVAIGAGTRQGHSLRVREVQRILDRLGYGAGKVDGIFGPVTEGAVRRFQSAHGLAVDGIVGPATLGELRSRAKRLERSIAIGAGYGQPGGSNRVRALQRQLSRLGYRTGRADGLFGPATQRAVRAFQADRRLTADGSVGPLTLAALPGSPQGTRRALRQVARETLHRTRDEPLEPTRDQPLGQEEVAPSASENGGGAALWMVILLVDLGLVAALLLPAAFSVYRRWRQPPPWLDSHGSILEPLDDLLYVEGHSDEPRIGKFRGLAYAMSGSPDEDPAALGASLLVRDESRRATIVVRLAEVRTIRPAEEMAGSVADEVKEQARGAARSHTYRGQLGWPDTTPTRRRHRAGAPAARRSPRLPGARFVSADRSPVLEAIGAELLLSGPPEDALPDEDAVQRVGARVDLDPEGGRGQGDDSVQVKVTLFAESERRHWEARLDDEDASFSVVPGDLEEDVRRLVIPHRLGALQQALAKDGIASDPIDLEYLPFVIEVGRQLERELAKRRLA